jgi:hypothetical protein
VVLDKLADLPILLTYFALPNSEPFPVFARPNPKVFSKGSAEMRNIEVSGFPGNGGQRIVSGIQQLANPFQTHTDDFIMNRPTEYRSEFGFQLTSGNLQ